MKKVFMATFVAAAILWGCEKKTDAPVVTEISGTWKYIGHAGGFAGFPFTPDDTVNSYIQVDTTNARILFNYENNEQQCTSYTFEKNDNGTFSGVITLADSVYHTTNQLDVRLLHDTLSLYPHGYIDAFTAYYIPSTKHFTWCDH